MEKNLKKNIYMYIHINITESLCCASETLDINNTSIKKSPKMMYVCVYNTNNVYLCFIYINTYTIL